MYRQYGEWIMKMRFAIARTDSGTQQRSENGWNKFRIEWTTVHARTHLQIEQKNNTNFMDESAIYSGPFCADHAKEQNNQMLEGKKILFNLIYHNQFWWVIQLEAKQMQKGWKLTSQWLSSKVYSYNYTDFHCQYNSWVHCIYIFLHIH